VSRGSDGHPVLFWLDDANVGDFICAFKIEGEPELVHGENETRSQELGHGKLPCHPPLTRRTCASSL